MCQINLNVYNPVNLITAERYLGDWPIEWLVLGFVTFDGQDARHRITSANCCRPSRHQLPEPSMVDKRQTPDETAGVGHTMLGETWHSATDIFAPGVQFDHELHKIGERQFP